MRRRRPARAAVVGIAVALLAACDGAPEPAPRTPSASAAVDTGAVAATTTLHLAGADVDVEVLPLVRADDHVVLTLDLTRDADAQDPALLGLSLTDRKSVV